MKKELKKKIQYGGKVATMTVELRFDDECENGHDSFAITGKIKVGRRFETWGCIHDEIREHFPELAHLIKWHLTSTDGPMYYIANTVYWAEQGNLEYARSSAVWPEGTLELLASKVALSNRLPQLLEDFNEAMKEQGLA